MEGWWEPAAFILCRQSTVDRSAFRGGPCSRPSAALHWLVSEVVMTSAKTGG